MTDRSGDFPRLDRLTDEQLQRLAHSEKLAERHDLALACFEEASRRFPGHAGILLEQLKCHQRLRNAASVEALARELGARLSADPSRLDELGEELQKLGLFSLAEETFRMLLNHPRAEVRAVGWSRVAALQLRTGSREDAAASLSEAEILGAGLPEVRSVKARICRDSDPGLARSILRDLVRPSPSIPPPFTANCGYLLAAVCEDLGLPGEAMEALERAKVIEQAHPLVARFRQQREAWRRWHLDALDFDRDQAAHWAADAAGEVLPAHAFLLGHPRSGTTLLEQMLDAHPALCSIEESDLYSTAIDAALLHRHEAEVRGTGFADWVRGLPERDLRGLRADYFARLAGEAGRELADLSVLDKNPGLTVSAARIARTLPGSRLIVVLRDPRDVCLSAYFQSTDRTPWSVNWLTLEETVDQYVFTMDLWRRAREKLVQPWIEVRYEDVVADPVKEGARVTGFLGLEWDARQADPAAHARTRLVRSPTHHEVLKPVHSRAVGRWRNYADWLAPFESRLRPFIEAFGYSGGPP
jgi:tetratricopeptide (TPR) repeat protein